ncbi:MAG: endonuclease/exonuclease/phosphatase family protein [bacterium]
MTEHLRAKILRSFVAFVCAVVFVLSGAAASENPAKSNGTNITPSIEGQKNITLKVMTINVRHNADFWEERFPLIADEIVRLAPDLIGIQEMEIGINQSKTLMELIEKRAGPSGLKYEKYERLKTGSDMLSGEGITIFSRYPIGKKGYADLKHGRPVIFARIRITDWLSVDLYNTHLHNIGGDEVKLPQAQKLIAFQKNNDAGFLTFLTGDLNSREDSQTIGFFIANSFTDTYRAIHSYETPQTGNTSPVLMSKDNAPQNFTGRIDYIFMKVPSSWEDRVNLIDSVVCFKNHDDRGLYPSDHLGVMTTVRIKY